MEIPRTCPPLNLSGCRNLLAPVNVPVQLGALGRKRSRCRQVGLQQKEQSVGRDMKIEIHKTVKQDSADGGDCARVKSAGKVSLLGREGSPGASEQ